MTTDGSDSPEGQSSVFPHVIAGDPDVAPASGTVFVMPFAYQPVRVGEARAGTNASTVAWYQGDPVSHERQRYFTAETSSVLHARARWWELRGSLPGRPDLRPVEFDVQLGGRTVRLGLKLPRMVLFEWDVARDQPWTTGDCEPQWRTRHHGYLLWEAYFADANQRDVGIADLCVLNEEIRYWSSPFPEYYKATHSDDGPHRKKIEDRRARALARVRAVREAWFGESLPAQADVAESVSDLWLSLLDFEVRLFRKGETTEAVERYRLFPRGESNGRAVVDWGESARAYLRDPAVTRESLICYRDSRAFVWTSAIMDTWDKAWTRPGRVPQDVANVPEFWCSFLNVDVFDPRNAPSDFERHWALERTYFRWREKGSIYGFTTHSGAFVGPPITEPPLWQHMRSIYFDSMLMLIHLRVACFAFSQSSSDLSSRVRSQPAGAHESLAREFERLRWDFALFANMFRFPLLTSQQQGIEMYARARKALDVDELFDELERQISATNDYVQMRASRRESDVVVTLNHFAVAAALIAVPSGLLGMGVMVRIIAPESSIPGDQPFLPDFWAILGAFLLSALLMFLLYRLAGPLMKLIRPAEERS